MRMRACVAAVMTLAAMSGCNEDQYAISIEPQGDAMQRTLTVTRSDAKKGAPLPPETVQSLQKAYAQPGEGAVSATFSGTFTGRTPDDIGGRGFYKHSVTAMGSATLYLERFRGEDDYVVQMNRRIAAADRVTDLLIAWFQAQHQSDPRFAKLGAFLDTQFRKDLQNLSLYLWAGQVAKQYAQNQDSGDVWVGTMFSIAQFFAERGYITPEQLPAYARAVVEAQSLDDTHKLMALIQRLVADRMGVPASQPVPDSLKFLADGETAKQSLAETFAATQEYKHRLEAREQQQPAGESLPGDLTEQLLFEMMLELMDNRPLAFMTTDKDMVAVSLHTTTQPAATNGQWDPATGCVSWSFIAESRSVPQSNIPQLCYAVWAQPAEKFQTEHFGQVVLEGWNLAFYGLWHASLTPAEAKEWDAFVDSLRPGELLPEKLAAFHFSNESNEGWDTPEGVKRTIAQPITGLIREALPTSGQ